jgi:hypothetical protein
MWYKENPHIEICTSMPVPTITRDKNMLFFLHSSSEPQSFVILKALKEKSNISRLLSDKMATAQQTSIELSTPNKGHTQQEKLASVTT